MSRVHQAVANHTSGGMNCAQAVLDTFAPELGVSSGVAIKVAAAFGGGMGRSNGVCGAVSAAYMVLGLWEDASSANRDHLYALVNEFNRRFKARHRSVYCTAILGANLSTPEGRAKARDEKLSSARCPNFVTSAVEILEEMRGEVDNQ